MKVLIAGLSLIHGNSNNCHPVCTQSALDKVSGRWPTPGLVLRRAIKLIDTTKTKTLDSNIRWNNISEVAASPLTHRDPHPAASKDQYASSDSTHDDAASHVCVPQQRCHALLRQ